MSEFESTFVGNVRRQFMAETKQAESTNNTMLLDLIEHWVTASINDFRFWREVADRLDDIRNGKTKRIVVEHKYKEWSRKFVASVNVNFVFYDYTQKGVPAKGCDGVFDVHDKTSVSYLLSDLSYTFSEKSTAFIVRFSIQRYVQHVFNKPSSVDDFRLEMTE